MKKIILPLMFILLSSFAFGSNSWDTGNWLTYWSLDNTDISGSVCVDSQNNFNGTIDATVVDTGQIGIVFDSYNSTELDEGNCGVSFPDTNILDGNSDFTISLWVYPTNVGKATPQTMIAPGGAEGGATGIELASSSNKINAFAFIAGTKRTLTSTTALSNNNWYHVIWTYSTADGFELFVNNVSQGSNGFTGAFTNGAGENCLLTDRNGNNELTGRLDEVALWSSVLPDSTISDIYAQGLGGLRLDNTTQTLSSVTLTFPTDTTHYNNNDWNKTIIIDTDYPANCDINNTGWSLSSDNTTRFYFNNVTTILDGNISFYVNCTDATATTKTTTFWFILDNTEPPIYFNYPSALNTTNINDTNRTICLDINTSDSYLYKVNLSIFNATGYELYNNASNITTGTTSYNWDGCIDTSSYGVGTYKIWVQSTDSHTAKLFNEDINVIKDTKGLTDKTEYVLSKGNFIIEHPKEITINTVKDFDRFLMEHKATKILGKTYINIEADNLVYLDKSDYPCHFVVNGAYWYDCVGLDNPKVTKMANNKYRIDYDLNTLSVITRSLGGLNYNNKNITFDVQQNLTLWLNDTNTGLLISNFTVTADGVTRTANGTNITMFVDANETHTVTVTKAPYTISPQNIYVGFVPVNYTFQALSSGTTLYFYDESTNTLLSGINVDVEIVGLSGTSYTTNTGSQIISGLPTGNYRILYGADDYGTRSYPLSLNATGVQTVYLYLLESNKSNDITFTVKNIRDEVLENITVMFSRLISSNWTTIIFKQTDFSGSIKADLNPNTQYYAVFSSGSGLYVTKDTYIEPVFLSYSVYLDSTDDSNFTSVWDYITYEIGTTNKTLNPVLHNFTFTVLSTNANIDYFGLNSTINGTLYIQNITGSPVGGLAYIALPLNASDNSNFKIDYFIKTSNPHLVELALYYSVLNISAWAGNNSLAVVAPDYKGEFSERFRILTALLIAIIAIAMFSLFIPRGYAPLIGIPILIVFAIPPIAWIPAWIVIFESLILGGFFVAFGDW